MSRFLFALMLLSSFCVFIGTASASTLYLNTPSGILFSFDTETGKREEVSSSKRTMSDSAYLNGNLYGADYRSIYSVAEDGSSSVISSGFDDGISSLTAYRGSLYAASQTTRNIYSIDPETGLVSTVGSSEWGIHGDLAFDSSGNLYGTVSKAGENNSYLARYDLATGASSLLGDIGFRKVDGLTFVDGKLVGVTENGYVLDINTASGAGIKFAESGCRTWGVAGSAPTPIPAAVWLMGSGLMAVGWIRKKIA